MITLRRASRNDAERIWHMQVEAFAGLLEKYGDVETNPGAEPLARVQQRLDDPATSFYFIEAEGETVGAIRVVDRKDGSRKRVSPLFILPDCRGRGYAQAAMQEVERIHGSSWELTTIAEEPGNCHLYEKLGYRAVGEADVKIKYKGMTLIVYQKD